MARTVLTAFEEFRRNIEITSLQSSTASTRQSNVRSVLSAEMDVASSFLSGSYIRSTLIAPLYEADIDIIMVLDPKYYESYSLTSQSAQSKLLDKVRRALMRQYTTTTGISRNGQAITIRYSDFLVDVVPAFAISYGRGYNIPDAIRGQWIPTDPAGHVTYMSQQNANANGLLIPLVKMVKRWNANIGKQFNSFYLEMLTAQAVQYKVWRTYSEGLSHFFAYTQGFNPEFVSDPVGYGSLIPSGLGSYERSTRFNTARERHAKALQYVEQGSLAYAFVEWQKIFGDYYFPSYG